MILSMLEKFKNNNIAFKRVFNSDDGKAVLLHLIKKTGFRKSGFDANNPHVTSYKNGMHDVIREIITQLNITDKDLDKMIQQTIEREDI